MTARNPRPVGWVHRATVRAVRAVLGLVAPAEREVGKR